MHSCAAALSRLHAHSTGRSKSSDPEKTRCIRNGYSRLYLWSGNEICHAQWHSFTESDREHAFGNALRRQANKLRQAYRFFRRARSRGRKVELAGKCRSCLSEAKKGDAYGQRQFETAKTRNFGGTETRFDGDGSHRQRARGHYRGHLSSD